MTTSWDSLGWLAAVPEHDVEEDGTLTVVTGSETDFWRETQYGFIKDDGHALLAPTGREFTASVILRGHFEELYDHAGLMLRSSETEWLKFGVEFVRARQWSAVMTHGKSDWSVQPAPDAPEYEFRMIRRGDAVILHARVAGEPRWVLQRVAEFDPGADARVGIMACSPKRAGFRVAFREFRLGDADRRPLHDLVAD
ncbi:hypothetical protein HNQ07_003524 [Deinococcus metalli]|uniref:DUF1349 domain-containing protein n=1 Tax=Deinococcus metalli TaxID=1141878 RepID=A0A7W8KIX9_9DEIO|nr:DUF1349 domain-containing protein [Deinococcus metalli]MBB5378023.1 hypothetical protein [Deinococcus metalli]GHF53839.1 hypothetical protein GCM10017781_32640 [Deinococcus metalli]